MKELGNRGIKTPTGKYTWSKRTIDVMLTTVNLLVPILTLELGQAAIRFSIESKTEDEKLDIYYNILLYSILLGFVILMIYPILYIFKVFVQYIALLDIKKETHR